MNANIHGKWQLFFCVEKKFILWETTHQHHHQHHHTSTQPLPWLFLLFYLFRSLIVHQCWLIYSIQKKSITNRRIVVIISIYLIIIKQFMFNILYSNNNRKKIVFNLVNYGVLHVLSSSSSKTWQKKYILATLKFSHHKVYIWEGITHWCYRMMCFMCVCVHIRKPLIEPKAMHKHFFIFVFV